MNKNKGVKLEICKVCVKRKFNPKKGIVCSITDSKPTFLDNCSDYEVDKIAYSKANSKGMPNIYNGISEGIKNETKDMSKGRVAFNLFRLIISFFR